MQHKDMLSLLRMVDRHWQHPDLQSAIIALRQEAIQHLPPLNDAEQAMRPSLRIKTYRERVRCSLMEAKLVSDTA